MKKYFQLINCLFLQQNYFWIRPRFEENILVSFWFTFQNIWEKLSNHCQDYALAKKITYDNGKFLVGHGNMCQCRVQWTLLLRPGHFQVRALRWLFQSPLLEHLVHTLQFLYANIPQLLWLDADQGHQHFQLKTFSSNLHDIHYRIPAIEITWKCSILTMDFMISYKRSIFLFCIQWCRCLWCHHQPEVDHPVSHGKQRYLQMYTLISGTLHNEAVMDMHSPQSFRCARTRLFDLLLIPASRGKKKCIRREKCNKFKIFHENVIRTECFTLRMVENFSKIFAASVQLLLIASIELRNLISAFEDVYMSRMSAS